MKKRTVNLQLCFFFADSISHNKFNDKILVPVGFVFGIVFVLN